MREQDRQALLTAAIKRTDKRLEIFKEHNSGIPEKDLMREFAQNEGVYWEDLETIINAAKRQLDQYKENICSDTQAALDALTRLEDILGEAYIGSDFDTIRAALTEQLTKTDDNVSCPRVANTDDINAELLEALKGCVKALDGGATDAEANIAMSRGYEAIARAKQKGK